jgi:hypothetical protein
LYGLPYKFKLFGQFYGYSLNNQALIKGNRVLERGWLSHKHEIKKTHVCFIEFDDVHFYKLSDLKYYGEGNSKGRRLEYDFEYCLGCGLRLLDGKPVMTHDILEDELEKLVVAAKNGKYVCLKESTLQHSDFEIFERLIQCALEFGKLKETSNC